MIVELVELQVCKIQRCDVNAGGFLQNYNVSNSKYQYQCQERMRRGVATETPASKALYDGRFEYLDWT